MEDLLEKEKAETSDDKLTFNMTYYPVFHNGISICYQRLCYFLMYLFQYFELVKSLKITQLEQYYLNTMRLGYVSHEERNTVWCVTQ